MQVRRQRRAARVLGGYPTFIQAPQFSVWKPTSLDEISTIAGDVPKWFVMISLKDPPNPRSRSQ
jgi:uncharacterized protein (DUF779 family)